MKESVLHIFLTIVCFVILCSCETIPGKKTDPDVMFVTTPHKVVKEMLKLAEVKKDDVVYDLGSGDGRVVIAAARDFGARGVGIELDKALVTESTTNAREAVVAERVKFLEEDFFVSDLSTATVVTVYLLPELNIRLIPKFLKELKPGSRVVSHRWEMGKWKPDMTLKAYGTTVYLWVVPAPVDGNWRVTLTNEKGRRVYTLAIKQDFQKITARLSDGKRQYSVEEANLEGNDIAISVADAVRGRAYKMSITGMVKGDIIEGTALITEGDTPFAAPYSMKAEKILN